MRVSRMSGKDILLFLYSENPTLGVGFSGAKGGEDDKKAPFAYK